MNETEETRGKKTLLVRKLHKEYHYQINLNPATPRDAAEDDDDDDCGPLHHQQAVSRETVPILDTI